MKKKYLILFIVVLGIIFLSLLLGESSVTLSDVYNALFSNASTHKIEIVRARIPRTIFGIFAGMALATSGLLLQSMTRNPIADAGVLGINQGASLFVLIGMLMLKMNPITQIILAFVGGVITFAIVYVMANIGGYMTPIKLALGGSACAIIISSLISTLLLPNNMLLERFRFYQLGAITGVNMTNCIIGGILITICLIAAYALAKPLELLSMGDEMASSLGINIVKVRFQTALVSVILASTVVAFCGPIGFVGLLVPHFIRLFKVYDLKNLMGLSMMAGAILLLGSDIVGRLFYSTDVGVIMAMIGAPIFIYFLRKVTIHE